MHIRIVPSLIAGCFYFFQGAYADTIVLNNGEKIEGDILREEDGNYIVEVKVSGSIKEEKIVPKSEVKLIEKEKEDVKAFKLIEELVPTPSRLNVEDYEARIERVSDFVAKYPSSAGVAKAEEMLGILNKELEVIRMGGVKIQDELIPAAVYNANAYEFDALIAGKDIADAINRRDFLRSLRLFTEYEKTFSEAEGRAEIAEKIIQVLAAFGARVNESLASFDSRMKARQEGLGSMSAESRAATERAIADQMESLEKRFLKEKEAKQTWITPDANHKASLEEARRQIESEMKRIQGKPTVKLETTSLAEAYRSAWIKLTPEEVVVKSEEEEEEEIEETEEELKLKAAAKKAEKEAILLNLKTLRMPEIYIQKLRKHAEME